MVKGVTRRVIVTKFPDPQLFEEAIFIVNGDIGPGVTQEDLLHEAQEIAGSYARRIPEKHSVKKLPRLLWALAGAVPVAAAWLTTMLL